MNIKLYKTNYTKDLAQSNAVAYLHNITKQIGMAIYSDSERFAYNAKRVIIYRKNKKMWLCCATYNNNVIGYNIFNKKIIQQKQSNDDLFNFVVENSLNFTIEYLNNIKKELKSKQVKSPYVVEAMNSIFGSACALHEEKTDKNGYANWEW